MAKRLGLKAKLVSRPLVALISALPEGSRYGAALTAARLLGKMRLRKVSQALQPDVDQALRFLLDLLDARGVRFALPLEVEGEKVLLDGVRSGKGVLLVGLHESLNFLPVRYMEDLGLNYLIFAKAARVVPGAARPVPTLSRSPTFMFKVRRKLSEGGVVGAMLDTRVEGPHMSTIEMPGGVIRFNWALFRVALRRGAQIVFVSTRLGPKGEVRITFGEPAPGSMADPAQAAGDFSQFIQQTLAA